MAVQSVKPNLSIFPQLRTTTVSLSLSLSLSHSLIKNKVYLANKFGLKDVEKIKREKKEFKRVEEFRGK